VQERNPEQRTVSADLRRTPNICHAHTRRTLNLGGEI
jgi:hypothetical protein